MATPLSDNTQMIKTAEKLKQWYNEAYGMLNTTPEAALKLAHRILEHAATGTEAQKYMVWGTMMKAMCTARMGRPDEALGIFNEAKRLHQRYMPKDKYCLFAILNNQANVYFQKGNHQLALNAFMGCLTLREQEKLTPIYCNIGSVYAQIGEYSKAIEFLRKAEAMANSEDDIAFLVATKNNILMCYALSGDVKQAKQMVFEVLAIIEAHPDKAHLLAISHIYTLNALGEIHIREKNFEAAQEVLKHALDKAQKTSFKYNAALIENNIAKVYFAKKDEEPAIQHIQKALRYTNQTSAKQNKKIILENVIQFYKSTNEPAKAFPFLEMLYELSQEELKTSRDENLQKIVTEREQEIQLLEEKNIEIEEQNAILKQFAYIISHDLREPLRGIMSFAGILNNKYSENLDKTANEYVQFILSEAFSMNRNLARLLEYTTIEKSIIDDIKEVDLQQIIANIQKQYADEPFQLNVTYQGVPIKMQRQHANVLLSELIDNAVQFRKENEDCSIEIKCELKTGHYQLSFKDYGIGIDAAYHDKIFKIFNKINKWKGTGTGVGLAICKRIVQLYKGEISVESISNQSTIFCIKIAV